MQINSLDSSSPLIFGDNGFMEKAYVLFERNHKVEVLIQGWRNRLLIPYVKELMGIQLSPLESKTRHRFGFLIRLFWLGPLMGCYGLALEKNMLVNIRESKENNFTVIEFIPGT